MASRQDDYLNLAKSKGFTVLEKLHSKKHLKFRILTPKGIEIVATMPSTPSHSQGPRNWIQDLKRLETAAIRQGAIPMPDQTSQNPFHKMTEADIITAKDTLVQMSQNTDLLIMKYTKEHGKPKWFLNDTRAVGRGGIQVRFPLWMLSHDLIQVASKEEWREYYSLTERGLLAATKHLKETSPVPPQEDVVHPDVTALRELTKRQLAILDATKDLTNAEVQKLLFYGFESLKDDVERELAELIKTRKAQLDTLAEGLKCLTS